VAAVNRVRQATRGERGHVLLVVAVLGMLCMALWGQAWRSTHDAIRVERFERLRDERTRALEPALERMVDLLRTGRPPSDPFDCLVLVTEDVTTFWNVRATFASEGDADHWSVDCRLATADDLATLPGAPTTFEELP
jgi:hypothetical protein